MDRPTASNRDSNSPWLAKAMWEVESPIGDGGFDRILTHASCLSSLVSMYYATHRIKLHLPCFLEPSTVCMLYRSANIPVVRN